MPRAQITLNLDALEKAIGPLDGLENLAELLHATAALADASAELLGMIPPQANPVIIARQHLANLQAAVDMVGAAGTELLVVNVLDDVTDEHGTPEPIDSAAQPFANRDEREAVATAEHAAKSPLERAGYQDGDLDRALIEQAQPGQQAHR